MGEGEVASVVQPETSVPPDMIWIPGGTFPHGLRQTLRRRGAGSPRQHQRLLD
jgi:hypothetical protein